MKRLAIYLNFVNRYCFPFGRPEGSLKSTLSLLERVLMKDIVTPVPPEEVRLMIKKSLETAALVNYTRLSSEAKIEGKNLHCQSGVFIYQMTFVINKYISEMTCFTPLRHYFWLFIPISKCFTLTKKNLHYRHTICFTDP